MDVSYVERTSVSGTEYDTASQRYKEFQTMYSDKMPEPEVKFSGVAYKIFRPVCAEFNVKKILNRHEFRAICDEYKSAVAIIERLKAGVA